MTARRVLGEGEAIALGRYPTPVQRVRSLSTRTTELWIKRDDLTHPAYGGNKVRKLERLLGALSATGARRLVTVGAAGSHHVLATTYFGTRLGFEVEAVLVPQPRTPHAADVLRTSLALGLRAFPVGSWSRAPLAVLGRVASGARYLPVGGSTAEGAWGYVTAARELAEQIRSGALPEPDVCVVALGSGGTAAGLAAGFAAEKLATRVLCVQVAPPAPVVRAIALWLAFRCARALGVPAPLFAMNARMIVDASFLGGGYGHRTPEGEGAARDALAAAKLDLDPTYTAKAFAAALALVRSGRVGRVLYWHTLSSAPMGPLLEETPTRMEETLGERVIEGLLPRAHGK